MSQKVVEPTEVTEQPLPEGVSWDTLSGKPTSLAEISIDDATTLATAASSAASAATGLTDLSIQGWTFNGTFSAASATEVDWTSGTLKFKDGTTFSIVSGSKTALSTSAPTYVYFDKAVSTTVLQTTATATDAVGANKVLMGVFQGNAASGKNAIYQVFGGAGGMSPFIGTNNIAASSITSALIAAGTIVASNIAAGTITGDRIAANTINTNQIIAGTITGYTITGSVITGTTLTTATSGQRVVLTSTLAQYYNSSGTEIVDTYASSNSFLIKGMQSASSIFLDHGATGTVAFGKSGSIKLVFDMTALSISPITNGTIDLGVSGGNFRNVQHTGIHIYQGSDMPLMYWGQVSGTTMSPDNTPGWSVSHPSTGKYTVSHSLGHSNYAVTANAIVGSGAGAYSCKVESFGSSNFKITIFDDTGVARDADFMFMCAVDPN